MGNDIKMNEQYQAYFYQERLIPMLVSVDLYNHHYSGIQ
jgi:hypothetical protein